MNDFQRSNYRRFQKYFRPLYDMMIDTSIQHPERVPEEGPCVVVANHRSDLDPFIIMTNVKRPINWFGASYLWNIPFFKDFLIGIGAIPISKYRSEIRSGFDKAADLLEMGQAVGIFPEGWDYIGANQFDWSVGEFQTGFARIAIETKSPVVPMALQGLDEIRVPNPLPPFVRKILDFPLEMQYTKDRCAYRKLHINVGRPIPCPEDADADNRADVQAFTKQVNEVVVELYNALPKVVGFENLTRKPAGPPKQPDPPAELEPDTMDFTDVALPDDTDLTEVALPEQSETPAE